jgi:hypothetical protein
MRAERESFERGVGFFESQLVVAMNDAGRVEVEGEESVALEGTESMHSVWYTLAGRHAEL